MQEITDTRLGYRLAAVAVGAALGLILAALGYWQSGYGRERPSTPSRQFEVRQLHRLDDTLGYALKAESSVSHREEAFSVEYNVGADGSRVVPGYSSDRPKVLVFGDSWTFGHGVDDDETYAAHLQEFWPDRSVRNLGVMGYGTAHVLLSLERSLEEEKGIALVLYGWTPIHLLRSYLRESNLKTVAGGRTPWLEFEQGVLVARGLADSSQAIPDDHPRLEEMEWERSLSAMQRMGERVRSLRAQFVVLILPGPEWLPALGVYSERMALDLRELGIEVLDLESMVASARTPSRFIPEDDHPNALWNKEVAEAIYLSLPR